MPMCTAKAVWLTGKETFVPHKTGKQNLSLMIYPTMDKFNPQVYWQLRQKQLMTSVRQHIMRRMRKIQQHPHNTQQTCSH